MPTGEYFHREMAPGLFLIGWNTEESIASEDIEIKPGPATQNSWLVIGQNRAVVVDSAAEGEGFRYYVEKLAGMPVDLVISHGHYDHTYRLSEFDEFWIHPADESLIRNPEKPFSYCKTIPENIHHLADGDILELGERSLKVYNVPGHTKGSIVLLDSLSGILISGDTVARRLLYMGEIVSTEWVPLSEFIQSLNRLQALDFTHVASAHDRFLLNKSHISYM